MTQRELAGVTGVPQPAIARIERGVVSPGLDTLERLLAGAGVTLEVVRRPGIGVDRSLIQMSLNRSPENRVLAAGQAGRSLGAWTEEAGRAGRA